MDTLTFISKLLEYCSWPASALGIVYLLRTQLQDLIPSIKKLKAGPLEIELDRVVKELEITKQVAKEANAKAAVVAAKFDEVEDDSASVSKSTNGPNSENTAATVLTQTELKVLKTMISSNFVSRSVSGVARESTFSMATVQSTYGSLIAKGLVEQIKNSEGRPRWIVTALGRTIAHES
jgi:DNA-binding MarR family transcriptional regulator